MNLTDVLRQAIEDSGQSYHAIQRRTQVVRQTLARFHRGEQTLTLRTAEKLMPHFGLRVVRETNEEK